MFRSPVPHKVVAVLVSLLLIPLGGVASAAPVTETAPASTASDSFEDFSEPEVAVHGDLVSVSFTNTRTGQEYAYSFERHELPLPSSKVSTRAMWKNWGWYLNREETRQMREDGRNLAVVYGIAAALGVPVAAIGGLVEGAWSAAASDYYAAGNCMYINISLKASEVRRGTYNCK